MADLKEIRHTLLKKIETELQEELIAALIAEETEDQPEILTAVFPSLAKEGTQADAEFLFMPTQEGDELQFFVSIINLANEIPAGIENELYAAMALLNFYLTDGSFAIEPGNGGLIYKNSISMAVDEDAEAIEEYMNRSMSMAIQMTDKFAGLLLEVIDGERTAEDIAMLLTGSEPSDAGEE